MISHDSKSGLVDLADSVGDRDYGVIVAIVTIVVEL